MKVDRAKLRKLVTIKLTCEEEDTDYANGHFQREDGSNDREITEWISRQLAAGNEWAWCVAHVTVTYRRLKGEDWLGGCSYASEEDFIKGDYYESMIDEALTDLIAKLEAIVNDHDIWDHDAGSCLWCVAS